MLPAPGEVLLLENLRFHAEEEKNDPAFAQQLATLGDVYVNDAFGTAHRAHASTVGIIAVRASHAPPASSWRRNSSTSAKCTTQPRAPLRRHPRRRQGLRQDRGHREPAQGRDTLLIGGAMAYTFLQAQGKGIGKSLVEADKVELAKQLLGQGRRQARCCPSITSSPTSSTEGAANEVVDRHPRRQDGPGHRPQDRRAFGAEIAKAKTIIWNGPMGVFEKKPFDKGTVAVAKAVAESGAVSVVGGGDSEKAIKSAGLADKISHISTGGGASLEFLSGLVLPGVAALTEK